MRVDIHADEVFFAPEMIFQRIRDGAYISRATVYPDDDNDEPYDIHWRLEVKDGTLYYSWPGMQTGPIDA